MDNKEKLELARDWYNDQSTTKKEKVLLEKLFPEIIESEDERIRKELIKLMVQMSNTIVENYTTIEILTFVAWLEKQGEQKPTQEIEPFEAEHGKYYYCIKDYFCGGRKQASKGDVVQALRGLPIMSLKDASEYFIPVNSIKCKSTWSEEDKKILNSIIEEIRPVGECPDYPTDEEREYFYESNRKVNWLKSIKPQQHWKPTQEQMKALDEVCNGYYVVDVLGNDVLEKIVSLYNDLKNLNHEKDI